MDWMTLEGWSRTFDVVRNRARMINHVMGYGVEGCLDNPCQIRMRDGIYRVKYCGADFGSMRLYDLSDVDRMLTRIDGLNDGLWLAMRSGMLRTTA